MGETLPDLCVIGGRGVLGVRGEKLRRIAGHVERVSRRVRDRLEQEDTGSRRRRLRAQQRDAHLLSALAEKKERKKEIERGKKNKIQPERPDTLPVRKDAQRSRETTIRCGWASTSFPSGQSDYTLPGRLDSLI